MISKIIKVSVSVISQDRRLRLIILTRRLQFFLDISNTKSNNCCIIRLTKNWKFCFCFFTDDKHQIVRKLEMIVLRNHALQSYMTWLPVILSALEMILLYDLQQDTWRFRNSFTDFVKNTSHLDGTYSVAQAFLCGDFWFCPLKGHHSWSKVCSS